MKQERLAAILEIVTENEISTQEELSSLLQQRGFHVTQATVSRDIKSLRLVKASLSNGRSVYVPHTTAQNVSVNRSFLNVFREAVLDIRSAGSLVVIRCHSGMGGAACEALDVMQLPEIVGTIAGDNTIFAAVEDSRAASRVVDKINAMLA